MDPTFLRKLLEQLGYTVTFRRQAWTECFVARDDERWLGAGSDEADALQAVLRQMLPSHVAQQLLRWRVARGPEDPEVAPEPAGAPEERIYGRSEALEGLHLLSERIDSERAELALMAPTRQRMVMLTWICHARTWEDRRPGDSFVARQVASIARKITNLGKVWWPGSVRSLHVNSTPTDAAAEAGAEGGWPPRNWQEAAEVVERRLHELFAHDEALGRDDYGWMDAERLNPPPSDPSGMLASIAEGLARLAGPVDEPARGGRGGYQPSQGDAERVARWARQLRWLRGSVSDFETWGACFGRLRWLALQIGARDGEIHDLLDSDYVPPKPWAEMQDASVDAESNGGRPGAELIDSVRDRTSGLRALFVGPDEDPEVFTRLETTFGLEVRFSDTRPVTVQTEARRIEQGSYDLLVNVTGFRGFAADARLSQACRRAKIPYVRVYRGRELATARAIAREMGIQ